MTDKRDPKVLNKDVGKCEATGRPFKHMDVYGIHGSEEGIYLISMEAVEAQGIDAIVAQFGEPAGMGVFLVKSETKPMDIIIAKVALQQAAVRFAVGLDMIKRGATVAEAVEATKGDVPSVPKAEPKAKSTFEPIKDDGDLESPSIAVPRGRITRGNNTSH